MIDQLFWDFAGKTIRLPKIAEHYPLDTFVEWHRGQVFKG
jgi:putative restriction endonuclease